MAGEHVLHWREVEDLGCLRVLKYVVAAFAEAEFGEADGEVGACETNSVDTVPHPSGGTCGGPAGAWGSKPDTPDETSPDPIHHNGLHPRVCEVMPLSELEVHGLGDGETCDEGGGSEAAAPGEQLKNISARMSLRMGKTGRGCDRRAR